MITVASKPKNDHNTVRQIPLRTGTSHILIVPSAQCMAHILPSGENSPKVAPSKFANTVPEATSSNLMPLT